MSAVCFSVAVALLSSPLDRTQMSQSNLSRGFVLCVAATKHRFRLVSHSLLHSPVPLFHWPATTMCSRPVCLFLFPSKLIVWFARCAKMSGKTSPNLPLGRPATSGHDQPLDARAARFQVTWKRFSSSARQRRRGSFEQGYRWSVASERKSPVCENRVQPGGKWRRHRYPLGGRVLRVSCCPCRA